jgi:nickel-dependent lactate racemase
MAPTRSRQIRTAAWYGDEPLTLPFPEGWEVATLWPDTPPPISDDRIVEALDRPVGQPPISQLARGKSRPLVIVDDLTRPTPAWRVLPWLLQQFATAGIPPGAVSVLMGTGTHGPPPADAMAKKVGPEAAGSCRLLVHDHTRNLVSVGRTSFGTPVIANKAVLSSDFLVGIGGIYHQHSTGFGGGSKIALGVLGKRSILRLHYGHPSVGGSYRIDNDFRRDLDEVARIIGLHTTIALHVDTNREAVRIVSGDHLIYFRDAVNFSKDIYSAPPPTDADVVVSNAYPMDVSLTFMRSKGMDPLFHAAPGASRIVVAACREGVGHHGLFPFMNKPRFERQIDLIRRVAVSDPRTMPAKIGRRLERELRAIPRGWAASAAGAGQHTLAERRADQPKRPIWLYAPGNIPGSLPARIPGMTAIYSWPEILQIIQREQPGRQARTVAVYPCAPLHVLDRSGAATLRNGV